MAGINNVGVANFAAPNTQGLTINNTGTINISSSIAPIGATYTLAAALSGTAGTINILSHATLEIGTNVTAAGNNIVFADATGGLQIDSPALFGTSMQIQNLAAGDSINIPNLPIGFKETFSNITVNNKAALQLVLKDAAGINALGTLVFGGNSVPTQTVVTNAVTQCFAAGTKIATPKGLRAVESLRMGDSVSLADGAAGTIEWVGSRQVDCQRHPEPEKVRPYRIAANAIARGIPSRDLYLSPDHSVFLDGVLVPVKYLDNGSTIRQVKSHTVTYYHFELEEHAVVRAEGLTVETLLPGSNKTVFSTEPGVTELYPDFAVINWEAMGCAPVVIFGEKLDAIRRRLGRRAAAIGPWIARRAA